MGALKRLIEQETPFIFACPALLWQILFLGLPLTGLLVFSVVDIAPGTASFVLTLDYYRQIFNSLYFTAVIRSFVLAFLTAIICFLVSYPVAYFLALKVPKQYKTLFLFLLIFPSWTSLIVQVYAWFFLLEQNGFLAKLFYGLGIISHQGQLLNNYFSILVGMVSCFLPFMVLPLYSVLEKMDKRFLEASADLGANRLETFRRIVFPLSLPGVYAGFLLVFIPAFGEFTIPILLGGGKYMFWGNVIVDKFLRSRDWRSGAAFAVVGIVFAASVIMLLSALVITYKKFFSYSGKKERV